MFEISYKLFKLKISSFFQLLCYNFIMCLWQIMEQDENKVYKLMSIGKEHNWMFISGKTTAFIYFFLIITFQYGNYLWGLHFVQCVCVSRCRTFYYYWYSLEYANCVPCRGIRHFPPKKMGATRGIFIGTGSNIN